MQKNKSNYFSENSQTPEHCISETYLHKNFDNQLKIIKEIELLKKSLLLQKQIFNLEEFCLYTGISKNQAYHLTSNGKVKFYRPFGKMIYFDQTEVIDFLKQNPVYTREEQNQKSTRFFNK